MKEIIIKITPLDLMSIDPKSVNHVFELLRQKIQSDCFEVVEWMENPQDGGKTYKVKYDPAYSI